MITQFLKETLERAVKTFAQGVLATQLVTEGASLDVFANGDVWSVGAAAAVMSILTSIATRKATGMDSPSAV